VVGSVLADPASVAIIVLKEETQMDVVWLVLRPIEGENDTDPFPLLGVYGTKEKAIRAVEQAATRAFPKRENFVVTKHEVK
jgi:hypothetical protein